MPSPTRWPRTLTSAFISDWTVTHGDDWESSLTRGLQTWKPRKIQRQGLTTITVEDWCIALGVSFKGYRNDLRSEYVQRILAAARLLPRRSTSERTTPTKWPGHLTTDFITTWIASEGDGWEAALESGLQAWSL